MKNETKELARVFLVKALKQKEQLLIQMKQLLDQRKQLREQLADVEKIIDTERTLFHELYPEEVRHENRTE